LFGDPQTFLGAQGFNVDFAMHGFGLEKFRAAEKRNATLILCGAFHVPSALILRALAAASRLAAKADFLSQLATLLSIVR
jgi:hypothetical protein